MTKSRGLISKKRKWTEEEIQLLTALYPCTKSAALAKLFNCNIHQLYNLAWHTGVKKSQWFKDSPMAQKLRSDSSAGEPYRFKKGQPPPNKGKKVGNDPRMMPTQFKPGHKPANHKPVGTIRISRDGYCEIKIEEGMFKWRLLHRIIYERMHGPVPESYIVTFVDSNKQNISIVNLTIIDKKQNCQRNSYHKYGKEIAQLYQLQAQITRQINKRNKKDERHSSAQSTPV